MSARSCNVINDDGNGGETTSLMGLFEPLPGVATVAVVAAVESPPMSDRRKRHELHRVEHHEREYQHQKTPKVVNHAMKKLDASLFQQLPSTPPSTADTTPGLGHQLANSTTSSESGNRDSSFERENDFAPPSPPRTARHNCYSSNSTSNVGSDFRSNLLDLFTPPPAQHEQQQEMDMDNTGNFSFNYSQTREDSPLIRADSSRTVPSSNSNHNKSTYTTLPAVHEAPIEIPRSSSRIMSKQEQKNKASLERRVSWIRAFLADFLRPTTWIGAFMFLLYHIVFSLTMGAAVMRPSHDTGGGGGGGSASSSSTTPIFGIMTKMSANVVMFAAVVFWWSLSDDIPALYPAVDLFCAPFLADLAVIVDETLHADENVKPQDNDAVFLASFTLLVCLGLTISGTLLMLSSGFKLANLGAFLPSPVLSGFFSAIAVLLWALAIKVDTGGISIGQILFSGDWDLMLFALKHHMPSVVIGSIMKVLSPMSPFFVIGCIFGAIVSFYIYMAIAHVGLQEMVEAGWFWSKDKLISQNIEAPGRGLMPPAPAGWINYMVHGKVHWGAVEAGLSSAIALALLYMIRCSLHGAALRKNIAFMTRYAAVDCNATDQVDFEANNVGEQTTKDNTKVAPDLLGIVQPPRRLERQMSETVDLNAALMSVSIGKIDDVNSADETTNGKRVIAIQSQPTKHTLTEILAQYAISQWVCALFGGFAIVPSIGPSATMYTARESGEKSSCVSILSTKNVASHASLVFSRCAVGSRISFFTIWVGRFPCRLLLDELPIGDIYAKGATRLLGKRIFLHPSYSLILRHFSASFFVHFSTRGTYWRS
jgi:hypothetical protein